MSIYDVPTDNEKAEWDLFCMENSYVTQMMVMEYAIGELQGALLSERTRANTSTSKLYSREAEIVQMVIDHDEGCNEGKQRFLEALGIDAPNKTVSFSVEMSVPFFVDVDDSGSTASFLASEAAANFDDAEVSDYFIEVNEDY